MSENSRERDLVLAPNEFAFISDQTKGNINVYVGPYKTSLANTDKPVIFEEETKRFRICTLEESIQTFCTAPEGWYIVMKNPPSDGEPPKLGTTSNLVKLNIGRKVNIPGPISFALWPGEMVRVIPGHHLRSNQYLLVRVYDEEEARKNWSKAVIKTKNTEEETPIQESVELTMGKLLIIKGEHVSFYIPPTGIEVVRDQNQNYVREAVTLERMEYCILLDENGNKRFVKGPAVVFPEPTEDFIEKDGSRKFRAIELNEISGLYIKVIAPYTENGVNYNEGDELFITGKDQMIYYPRPEHAIIKYGDKERHYSVAIPAGEGRYYLNRLTGKISLMKGPCMFLPDPRKEVFVRRIIEPEKCRIWFPGNEEAYQYNLQLKQVHQQKNQEYVEANIEPLVVQEKLDYKSKKSAPVVAGTELNRGSQFTPPRTLVLENKFEGAVTINLWTGYAILVVSKTGTRKVMMGPEAYLLEYDEDLQAISLSTGTPKTDQKLLKTVYLRVTNNKVSDIVLAETSDFCHVSIQISYRLNFEGEKEKWFEVENYVKHLTEHGRSLLRNAIKRTTIMEFHNNGIDIVRDTILGKIGENGKRPGRKFEENGMVVYDIEILDIKIGDQKIEELLIQAQHDVIKQNLSLAAAQRQLVFVQNQERVHQETIVAEFESSFKQIKLEQEELLMQKSLELVKLNAEIEAKRLKLKAEQEEQDLLNKISTEVLGRSKHESDFQFEKDNRMTELRLKELAAEVNAVVEKAGAVSPELIAALQAFSDRALAEKMAESMAPLAILGGKSVAEVFSNLLKGTPVAKYLLNSSTETEPETE